VNTPTRYTTRPRNRAPASTVLIAAGFTAATLWVGYLAFGLITMLVFTAGFASAAGAVPRLLGRYQGAVGITLLLFLLHRAEERQMGFFAYLSEATGVATPALSSTPLVLLLVMSVGAWLLVPVLMPRGNPFGRYLAWTFFASMGIAELAHFAVFPWLGDTGPHYVPGMWTVPALAAVAWFGMWRLATGRTAMDVGASGAVRDHSPPRAG
jgi:hypothetical protein